MSQSYQRGHRQHAGSSTGRYDAQARQQDFPKPTETDLKAIIEKGDVDVLIESAEKIGYALGTNKDWNLSRTQLRSVFNTVRKIEMRWRNDNDDNVEQHLKQLRLLKPRLAYQAGRAKQGVAGEARGILYLGPVLQDSIKLVTNRHQFQNFVQYLEAIVGYHRFAESSNRKRVANRQGGQ